MITVNATIQAPITKVWEYWTNPAHVKHWNFAASDWHCPEATNNLVVGGEFHYTMSAKDNSFSFDFWGTYQEIINSNSAYVKQFMHGEPDGPVPFQYPAIDYVQDLQTTEHT